MADNPLISVIVPCFNEGNYLIECLDSVHNQSYKNYEIIVVNDGSTDADTNALIREIKHPRVKVLETKNQGVSLARNTAIAASDGAYILPLDADDKVGTDFIQTAIPVLERNAEIKLVTGEVELFGIKKGRVKPATYSLDKLLARNLFTVSSIFRRSDFDKTPGFNPNMKKGFEDWDFWISLLKNGGSVHQLQTVGLHYRIKRKSRNNALQPHYRQLRRQIYENHSTTYAKSLLDPQESFEYELITQSREYQLGTALLKPMRRLHKLYLKFMQ